MIQFLNICKKELNTRANLCENIFLPAFIKNDNGAVAIRFFFAIQVKPETQSMKKVWQSWIEDLLKCIPMFLFCLFKWNWRCFALHKMRPLKWFKTSASTNKLSKNFTEHVYQPVIYEREISHGYHTYPQSFFMISFICSGLTGHTFSSISYCCIFIISGKNHD